MITVERQLAAGGESITCLPATVTQWIRAHETEHRRGCMRKDRERERVAE